MLIPTKPLVTVLDAVTGPSMWLDLVEMFEIMLYHSSITTMYKVNYSVCALSSLLRNYGIGYQIEHSILLTSNYYVLEYGYHDDDDDDDDDDDADIAWSIHYQPEIIVTVVSHQQLIQLFFRNTSSSGHTLCVPSGR
jgi:hypothetical protein